jgi:hypothetical protein
VNISADGIHLGELPDGTVPIGAATALKAMTPDGKIVYLITISDELSLVESLGMARHAQLVIEDAIMHPPQPAP